MNSVIKTMEKQKSILSPQERRQRNRDRNREEMKAAILDAARAVMREEGVAALNLQEVARRVGVRAPSLYEYFPGKSAIYDALFRLGVRLFAERSELLAQTYPSVWEYARASLEHYMTFAQDYPELYQLCFERPVPGFVPSEESMNESRQLLMGRAAQIVEQGLEHGSLVPGLSPVQTRDLFLAMTHGLTALHMANEPELPVGAGRFGSLIPAAMALFQASWDPEYAPRVPETETDSSEPSPHSQE
jgi:AcrR family transcriptional regulator